MLLDLANSDSLTFRGKLFAEDKAIIYDITVGEPVKRRRKRKADEEVQEAEIDERPAEEPEAAESDSGKKEKAAENKPKRGRRKK